MRAEVSAGGSSFALPLTVAKLAGAVLGVSGTTSAGGAVHSRRTGRVPSATDSVSSSPASEPSSSEVSCWKSRALQFYVASGVEGLTVMKVRY